MIREIGHKEYLVYNYFSLWINKNISNKEIGLVLKLICYSFEIVLYIVPCVYVMALS
jgi:hypothetical protein